MGEPPAGERAVRPTTRQVDTLHLLTRVTDLTNASAAQDPFQLGLEALCEWGGWKVACMHAVGGWQPGPTQVSGLFNLDFGDPYAGLRRLIRSCTPARRSILRRAIDSGEPVWTATLPTDEAWAQVAAKAGLGAAVAVPVKVGDDVEAVLVFLDVSMESPDEEPVRVVSSVATQLGRVLERRQATKARAYLGTVVDSSSDAIVGISLDGAIVSWNRAAEGLYGFTPDEAIGNPVFWLVPDDREHEMLDMLEMIGQGMRLDDYETVRRHKDGREFDVQLTLAPLLDPEGQVTGCSQFARDITERRRVERRLAHYKAIVKSSDEAIIATGADGRIVSANHGAEQLYGWSAEELLGMFLGRLIPGDRKAELEDINDQIDQGGSIQSHETVWVRKDGSTVDVSLTISPIRNRDGATVGTAVLGRDITERMEAERQLRRTNQELARSNNELEKFAYIVSHDLKAPMRAIDNLSCWIEEDTADALSGETKEHMQLLRGRVSRMEALLNGLLQYSRAGRLRAAPELVDAKQLFVEILEMLCPPASFEVVIEGELPVLTTYRAPLKQVLMNLLGNAIKHHDQEGGRIILRQVDCDDPERVAMEVEDDGPGIDPKFHERVFEIFQTLKRRDEVEGTGMGLAIVKKVVDTFDGSVTLESEGRGTTIRFTWPRSVAEEDT